MPELSKRSVLKVFLASPGDLTKERKIAYEVVQRLNKSIGRNIGVEIDLRGWEDTLPGRPGRPQEAINEDLMECDVFLGLVWKRWGSPPGGDDGYESGFEEEYNIAIQEHDEGRMREVFLYFKRMPEALEDDPGPQALKVRAFRESIEQSREVFYDTFEDTQDWGKKLYDTLNNYLTKHFWKGPKEAEKGQRTRRTKSEQGTDAIEVSTSLHQLLARLKDSDVEQVSHWQIARAHLYTASLLYHNVHTDHLLDTDEVHYLYSHREQIKLEKTEAWLILRSLLGDRQGINAGWYWINPDKDRFPELLAYLAANDELDNARLEALRLLKAVSTDTYRETIRQIVESTVDTLKVKALNQFATSAGEADLKFLRPIATQEKGDLAEAAWRGVLIALSHHDSNAAVNWIIETPEPHRGQFKDVLDRVLEDADSDHVRKLLTIEDESARFRAMKAAKEEMEEAELRELTLDDDPHIAAVAFMELIVRGHDVDEKVIDEQLDFKKKVRQPQSTTWLGQALATYPTRQLKGYTHEDVLYVLYKTRDEDEFKDEIAWSAIKSPIRYAALADQNYDEFVTTLQADIASGFERIRNEKVSEIENSFPDAAEGVIEKLDEYEDFIRGSFYRAAFQVLARHATPGDLEIARSFTQDPHQSMYKDTTLEYALDIIGKYGTTEDVDLIKPFVASSRYSLRDKAALMLLELDPEHRREHALELLAQDEWKLKKMVFRYFLDEEYVLPIDPVLDLLYESDEETRLGALAYLVQKLKEDEIEALLEDYPNADNFYFYYYDVICWLDRLVHAPDPIWKSYRDRLKERLEETESLFELV